jgi:putative transposase
VAAPHPTAETTKPDARETLSQLIARILDQLSVSAWLPAAALVFMFLLVGSLRHADGDLNKAIAAIGDLDLAPLVLLLGALILSTMLTQAFEFEAIRLLEGYWGTRRLPTALAQAGCRLRLARRRSLRRQLHEAEIRGVKATQPVLRRDGYTQAEVDALLAITTGQGVALLSAEQRREAAAIPWMEKALRVRFGRWKRSRRPSASIGRRITSCGRPSWVIRSGRARRRCSQLRPANSRDSSTGCGSRFPPRSRVSTTSSGHGWTRGVHKSGSDVGGRREHRAGVGVACGVAIPWRLSVVLSLVYVIARRLFELVALLGRGERSKELEILVLRHELSILRRQVSSPRFAPRDRLVLAALSRVLPRRSWSAFLVRPETLLRWHRRLVANHWTYPHRGRGRPPIDGHVRELILRLARENTSWGYLRIVGELRMLGIDVSATLVRNVLRAAGVPPAPQRDRVDWRSFMRQHAATTLACDFLTVDTVLLRRVYVLVFICIGSRRIEYTAATSNPDGRWIAQQARNVVMDLDDRGRRPRFLVHDRDATFSGAFDAVFHGEGMRVIRTPLRAPNANAHIERWFGSLRRECLDRLLILGRRQLERVLRVYVRHYNHRRPHRALDLRAPDPRLTPSARGRPAGSAMAPRRRDLLGGLIHEYEATAA